MLQRLQKLISAAGIASRRSAEQLILSGHVLVNGIPAVLGQSADPERDEILVDGRALTVPAERTYVLLNKPRGYVTTLQDEQGRPTVADLVKNVGKRLYPVGRLDLDSDGLLLMTDDGAFAHDMCHPSREVTKTYRTCVSGDVEAALPLLRAPLELDGYRIRPAQVHIVADGVLEISIHEGRNRQIRRMCAAAGLRVRRLTRIAEGPLELGELLPGHWRYLSKTEIEALRNFHRVDEKT